MTLPKVTREDWYEVAKKTNWDPTYVDREEMFPDTQTGLDQYDIPWEAWEDWEETYKQTYREYVETQREKDSSAYAIKSGLSKAGLPHNLGPGWNNVLKLHFGSATLAEVAAVTAEDRFARFAPDSAWRQMAQFGALDEIRHGEIERAFPHEFVKEDPQYDWTLKALHTDNWVSVAARSLFDDLFVAEDVMDSTIGLNFAFETGFTNLQFLAMAADAEKRGDYQFSEMISTIQTDEARHAQQGNAALEVLKEYDKERAQYIIDKSFWRCWRVFAAVTGPSMDYWTPVEHREMSFKEFMDEWIVDQFLQNIETAGLEKPWYWDQFKWENEKGHFTHEIALGFYFWRPTAWFAPTGVTGEGREWLEEHYPGWEDKWGKHWDHLAERHREGDGETTLPQSLVMLCNTCQLPMPMPDPETNEVRPRSLTHEGDKKYFCSDPCQWIWENEPDRFKDQTTIMDRLLDGTIQPATLGGVLLYMDNLENHERGKDPDTSWADDWASTDYQPTPADD